MKNFFLCISLLCAFAGPAQAQKAQRPMPLEAHIATVKSACPGNWERPGCLRSLSRSNHDMVVNYAVQLEGESKETELESLKQVCAAASVWPEERTPAYAFASAYTECANGIADISERSGVKPDATHYQLLVAGALCLAGDPRCAAVETGLGN